MDVEDADVQQMIEESVEHAFDDIEERRWIEAKLRIEQTVEATLKGLEAYGSQLPKEQCGEIEAALTEAESLLTEKEKGGALTAASLKEFNAKLDSVTQPLADLMMDKVMEQMLEKKGVLPN